MATRGKKKQLLGYAHAFVVAAEATPLPQGRRGVDGQVDAMMCVIALQNSVVGQAGARQGPRRCAGFHSQVPDLKGVRDMLTHFYDYAIGRGWLQKVQVAEVVEKPGESEPMAATEAGTEAESTKKFWGWMPMWNPDETVAILKRPKGEDLPTLYEVPIHKALKRLQLVLAAALFLEMEPTPLVKALTSSEPEAK